MATLTDSERAALREERAELILANRSFRKGERANRMNVGDEGVGFAEIKIEENNRRIREIDDLLAIDSCSPNRRRPFHPQW